MRAGLLAVSLAVVGCGEPNEGVRDGAVGDGSVRGDAGTDAGAFEPCVAASPVFVDAPGTCEAAPPEVSVTFRVQRAPDLGVDPLDPDRDARGRLAVAVFRENPYCLDCDEDPMMVADRAAIDLSDPRARVEIGAARLAPGPPWILAWLDDRGEGVVGGPFEPATGDLVTGVAQAALACGDTLIDVVLRHRALALEGATDVAPELEVDARPGDLQLFFVDRWREGATHVLGAARVPSVDPRASTRLRAT